MVGAMIGLLRVGLTGLTGIYLCATAVGAVLLAQGPAETGWPARMVETVHLLLLPAPFLLLVAFLIRARIAQASTILQLLSFVHLYGAQFVPRTAAAVDGPGLRVRYGVNTSVGPNGAGKPGA
jgi:hypothetical protein